MLKTVCLVLSLIVFVAACSGDKREPTAREAGPAADAMVAPEMPRSAAPADARVYFIEPADGDVVSNPVSVVFGLDGMSVVPAGTQAPASGHHHLLIDVALPPADQPIPADDNHVHFGTGAESTSIELSPGEHTLQLLLGDHLHIPHDPPVASDPIRIVVE